MKRLAAPVLAGIMIFTIGSQVLCRDAIAALGEKEASIEADRQTLSATMGAVTVQPKYTVREINSGSVAVREYLTKDGTVFGVAWKGRSHPDLSSLLGSYYSEYQEMASRRDSKARGRGGRKTVQGAHVVVEKFGHMRALRGRAYVPSLLPAGVNPNEIK